MKAEVFAVNCVVHISISGHTIYGNLRSKTTKE